METAAVKRFEEPQASVLAGLFRFDPLLALAGAGLVGCRASTDGLGKQSLLG